jgi:hypothetical protein
MLMELESVFTFLNNSELHTFYPFAFPSSDEVCSVVNVTGGTVKRGGVQKIQLRVLTRETHPSKAIKKSHEIKKYLYENFKGAFFNGLEVLNIEANTPEPLLIGEENGAYSVSWNYTIIEG